MQALPIDPILPELLRAVSDAGRCVVEAPPGAGKSTRVPWLLAKQSPLEKQVWVSEPRRLAARLLASRVASELNQNVGEEVGYAVRFDRKIGPRTRLVYCTTGVLLKELFRGNFLSKASAIIIDEVHERSLETDLLLALLRKELAQSRAFELVVMSATLDAAPIAEFLSQGHASACPIIQSAGKAYPLDIFYQEKLDERPLEKRVASAVRHHLSQGPEGDILVFLPGAREIRLAAEALEPLASQANLRVLPLHGSLDLNAQQAALAPSAQRKVVLATNVAESSVTVPKVTGVIDSGLAQIAEHASFTGSNQLKMALISRASADQRAGRAGRTAKGWVQRLYSSTQFKQRPAFDEPEILRTDLTQLALQLAALELSAAQLKWLTPPSQSQLSDADKNLTRLGAIAGEVAQAPVNEASPEAPTPSGAIEAAEAARAAPIIHSAPRLTQLGEELQRLPTDPRLGRVLLAARELGALKTACLAVALLSERDILRHDSAGYGSDSFANRVYAGSDIYFRIELFEEARAGKFRPNLCRQLSLVHPAQLKAIERIEEQLLRYFSRPNDECPIAQLEEQLTRSLIYAFPDRVALRGAGDGRGLTFFSGNSGQLSTRSLLAQSHIKEPLLLALEVQDRRPSAERGPARSHLEVSIACPIKEDWLYEAFPDSFYDRDELTFNPSTERVEKTARLYYGSLCLDERRSPALNDERAAEVLFSWVKAHFLTKLDPKDTLGNLSARIYWIQRAQASTEATTQQGAQAISYSRDELLRQVLKLGVESGMPLSELAKQDLEYLALSELPSELVSSIEKNAPREILLGGGRRVPVHYEISRPPWVESFLQDFFGCSQTPSLFQGKIPLTVHLLAPNRRAIQVTQDLASFWQTAYPELRNALSRRYPRHAWPEDGGSATPPPPRPPRRPK